MKLLKAAIFEGYTPRKDKSTVLRFSTQELSPNEVGELHANLDAFGFVYFRQGEQMNEDEIEELDNVDADIYDKPKKQSQRIRAVLAVLYNQDDEGYKDFKSYYKAKTDKFINWLKGKIED